MPSLTTNQVRGFWAAWPGWALDGMDSFIYSLVLVPSLRDLLPRFGRLRTLALTILCYSLFTFLGCAATSVGQLALFRFLAGIGIGGEWTESRRQQGAAWMHTDYYVGTFLAAIVNYYIGAHYGWRAVFAVNGAPALLIAFIRYGVRESARWQHRVARLDGNWSARIASWATMRLSTGTILGCLALPSPAARLGRRGALAAYFVLMFVCSAFAFATSIGRFLAAGVTFLVGAGVAHMHTIGTPLAITSVAFLIGLAVLPLAEETRGKELPA